MDNQRNLILAVVLTGLILFGWDAGMRYFYPDAYKPKPAVAARVDPAPDGGTPTREDGLTSPADIATEVRDLKTALNPASRVAIAAPGLVGSINLAGAAVDDLSTTRHTAALGQKNELQRIFSPAGTPAQHFAQFGWAGQGVALPTRDTLWTAPQGAKLTPKTPVTLTWNNGGGQIFAIRYAIDADYMLTVTQTVTNAGTGAVVLQPVAQINRTGKTASIDSFNVHSGPIGAFDEKVSFEPDYDDVAEAEGRTYGTEGRTDWIGFTDIYWMSTLIPERKPVSSDYRAMNGGIYIANVFYGNDSVAPGASLTRTTRLFAGAKESAVLDRYEDGGIVNFGLAIDWGWFRWFEKPIFTLLLKLFELAGNFGVAIILLTMIVRGIMFPIANKQFKSMAAMKAIQPKMKAIQERYKDDRQKQQQEVMDLYKKEGVNPLAGCLPIFLQIPIFFALYKVLILAIEMRHQPFVLWIKDLSAPDPLHFLNLFGLLPFTPPSFLAIGVLALLLGVTMWMQFRLNPAQMDPIQEQMFKIMPWLMMFIMAPFAAGLLIYWITSNILTIAQQKYLYSKHPALQAQAEKDAEATARAKERSQS